MAPSAERARHICFIFPASPGAASRRSSIPSRRLPPAPPHRGVGDLLCVDPGTFWPDLDAVVVCTSARHPRAPHRRRLAARSARPRRETADRFVRWTARHSCRGGQAPDRWSPSCTRCASSRCTSGSNRSPRRGRSATSRISRAITSMISPTGRSSTIAGGQTRMRTPLVYSGCHFVDLLRWLAGEEIIEVFAAAGHRAFPEYPDSVPTSSRSVRLGRDRTGGRGVR